MAFDTSKHMPVGAKVRVIKPMDVPEWSKWDDDKGRTSATVKKRIHQSFFRGSKNLAAEIMYIGKESEREKLRRLGRVKVRVRDQSGCALVFTADPKHLTT